MTKVDYMMPNSLLTHHESDEFKSEQESIKYSKNREVKVNKHSYSDLKDFKMINASDLEMDKEVEFELSEEKNMEEEKGTYMQKVDKFIDIMGKPMTPQQQ
eukprot:CAMPEP_0205801944 /NCGR_PEP_ID=MMETSP0205-20121125/4111_1 /ASSEMBLY_ACC=CAM_ASM_000278 /TAXON_ID=36767 /ORGANISM="Euplotes focardii, Strain TN1" /LENGTH=100 /DNA_ID=CAMNT_0053067555 /DNA_START=241 /DNA_END=543 /DNA_ORIENTATION=+